MNDIEKERKKYEKVYAFPAYGSRGHGAPIAGYLLSEATGRGVLGDFGCGRGGSLAPYIEAGFTIQPIDHVSVLDSKWKDHSKVLPLAVANLWADPLPLVDYGLCTDVAEHIPEQHVSAFLSNVVRSVRIGCLWTVCHVQDVWGDRIKDRLHMTVRAQTWWTDQMRMYWPMVKIIKTNPGHTVYWSSHVLPAATGT